MTEHLSSSSPEEDAAAAAHLRRLTRTASRIAQARYMDKLDNEEGSDFGPHASVDIDRKVRRIVEQAFPDSDAETILPEIEAMITEAGGQDAFLEIQAAEREAHERQTLDDRAANHDESPVSSPQQKLGKSLAGRFFRRR